MRKFLLLAIFSIAITTVSWSQSCIPTTINGSVLTIGCGTPCTSFSYTVPHLKATTDYLVSSIPINMLPTGSGTAVTSIYIDDKYSPLISMPFPFCFYGLTYNNVVVGSNGIITFEALCANASNAYTLSVGGSPQTIPYAGGAGPSGIGTTYYPRTAIMGAYQDIDPSITTNPLRRIEYNITGTAPCRKFYVSFVDVKLFQCNSLYQTSQIVLNESTGIIDVNVLQKQTCTTWPSAPVNGLAILGIQDETRTKAVAAPGKNCTQWTEANTAYRFTPNGGTSNFVSAQMYTMGGVLVATADTSTTTPGILNINFPNFCPPNNPSTQFVIRTTFNSCLGAPMVSSDTITVNRVNSLPANITSTPTNCGSNTGSVTVTPTSGTSPYTYVLNGGSPVTAPGAYTFNNLAVGSYTVVVTDANGCTNTLTINVTSSTTIPGSATMVATSCPLSSDGTITVTPGGGNAPYQFSLDGGPPQSSNVFTNVSAGSHTITFTDAGGCSGTVTITVNAGSTPLTANVNATSTACPGVNNGTITVTPTSGSPAYQYSLDGGGFQAGDVFTNVSAGLHSVTVKDQYGCTGTFSVNVAAGPALTANLNSTGTSCPGVNNGTITVTPTNGSSPYQYSLDGGAYQPGNVFTNVSAGIHNVVVKDASGCTNTFSVSIAAGPSLTANVTSTVASCAVANNGTITANPTNGTSPYQYSLDGGPNQPGNTFSNVLPGNHTVTITDANGCINSFAVNVGTGPAMTANLSSTATSCPAVNNGTITVTPTSGTAPYQYSLDGGPNQPGNVFNGVSAGIHNVTVTDNYGCSNSFSVNVAAGPSLTATVTGGATSCPAVNNGSITATPTNGTAPYQYSLDGGPNQPGNIFNGVSGGPHNVTITDANGCVNTFPVNVPVGPSLAANVTSTSTTCPALSDGTITATPTNGTSPYQYSLDGGGFQAGNVFTNVSSGSHNVTVRDANGCTNTFPVNVAQGSALTSTINGSNPPCNNINNGSITINPTSGQAPYQYSLNGGPNQPGNTFSGLPQGTYTITFTDINGCVGSNTFTLTTNPAITATFTGTSPLCNGNSNGSITINASGGVAPYQYSKDGGATYQTSSTFNNLTAGTYTIRVKDAVGCMYDFTYTLTEPSALTVSTSATPASCSNDDGSITVNPGNGTPPYQFSIDNGSNYSATGVFNNLPIGNYNVVVKDANGCMISTAQSIVLNDTMRLELGPDSTICFGTPVTMAPQTNAGTNYFKWTTIPAFISGEIDKDTIANATITAPYTKKYYLLARWGVCSRNDSIQLNVLKKPVANAGADTIICAGTPALLHGSASNYSGPLIYNWTPRIPQFLFVTPDSTQAIVRPDSTMNFFFNVKDDYGCNFSVFDTMKVFIDPPVPAFAGNDTNALLGQPHHLKATGGVNYSWSPAGPLNNANISNPTAILYNDTYFRVTVTDAAGCSAFDDVFIKVYEGPTYYMPNAFTPNGDGLNDVLYPTTVGMKFTDYFMIFDRYGELMFQTREFQKGWDGTYKGKPADQGTYVWIIKGRDENGKLVEMKGTVLIIR